MTPGFSDGDPVRLFLAAFVFVVIAVLVLGLGVWFGMVALAPRIGRRLDRSEEDREEPGDRHD
jgi:hypothetical protein